MFKKTSFIYLLCLVTLMSQQHMSASVNCTILMSKYFDKPSRQLGQMVNNYRNVIVNLLKIQGEHLSKIDMDFLPILLKMLSEMTVEVEDKAPQYWHSRQGRELLKN